MSIRYRFHHYCPYLDRIHAISIDYAKINLIGDPKTHYKIIGFSCEYASDCPYPENDEYGRCPVYLAAPDEPV